MLSKTNIYGNGWVDMVFDGRNHEYGAFVLRKRTPHTTFIAIISVVAFFIITLGIPVVLSYFKEAVENPFTLPGDRIIEIGPDIVISPPEKQSGGAASKNTGADPKIVDDKDATTEMPDTTTGKKGAVDTATSAIAGGGGGGKDGKDGADTVGTIKATGNEIKDYVGIMPEFPGGDLALQKYIARFVQYPPIAVENKTEGKVVVSVVIEKDGSISNIKVISKKILGDGLEEESVRVIGLLPKWSPGRQNDIPVRVRVNIPIKFRLN